MDTLSGLLGFPKICSRERVEEKAVPEVELHGGCQALNRDPQASPSPLMGKLRTSHKLSRGSKISSQRSFYFHLFEAAFPFLFLL